MGRSFVAQAALRREGSQFKELAICLRAFVIVDTGSSVIVQPPLENQEIASLPISCGVTAELAIGFSGRCAVYHFSNAAG
jgi:hypothetical protein